MIVKNLVFSFGGQYISPDRQDRIIQVLSRLKGPVLKGWTITVRGFELEFEMPSNYGKTAEEFISEWLQPHLKYM